MSSRASVWPALALSMTAASSTYADGQCGRLFEQPQEIATCNALVNLSDTPLGDDQLQEEVSQQVHGRSYAEVQASRKHAKQRAQEAEKQASTEANKDRCGRLFEIPYERHVCRWHQVVTGGNERDADLRKSVAARIKAMQTDPALKEAFIRSLPNTGEAAAEQEKWQREQAERRQKQQQRARVEAAKLSAVLRSEDVGLVLKGWRLGGYGVVLLSDFLIQNNNKHEVRDIRIECRTYGDSGTPLSVASSTVYSKLRPGERRSFDEVNLGRVHPQSARASCRLVGWK